MLHYARNSQHSQNIQINKVIGESEKCVFYFLEETKQTFWLTKYLAQHNKKLEILAINHITCLQNYKTVQRN